MLNKKDIQDILSDITYKNWEFNIQVKDGSFNLQISLPNKKNGEYYISPYISKNEIIQKCIKSVLSLEEQEFRLNFKYKDTPLFHSNYNFDYLLNLSKLSENRKDVIDRTSLEIKDSVGNLARVNDLRLYNGKKYYIKSHGFKFSLERDMFNFHESETIDIHEDNIWESELIGVYDSNKKYI